MWKGKPNVNANEVRARTVTATSGTLTTLTVAAMVAVGGLLSMAGSLAVSGALSAGNVTASSMTVTGALAAGSVGIGTAPVSGYPARVRAGTGTGGGTVPVLLYSWSGSSYTHAASGYMLAGSYVVPANTIVNVGDQLRTFIIALATTTNQSKGAYCDFNGDDVEQNFNTTTNEVFQQTSCVSYGGANNMVGYALKVRAGKTGGSTTVNDFDEVMAWNPASNNTINCYVRSAGTGNTGVDADMKLIRMEVWLEPAPL